MAATQLSDAIIPEVFTDYTDNNSPEKTAFVESGIAVTNPILEDRAKNGGNVTEIPHWNDLDADDEPNLSDDSDDLAVPKKVDAGKQIARNAYVNQAWSTKDLVGELAGDDPMRRIRDRTDRYWQRNWQKRILASCEGIRLDNTANDADDMQVDISIEDGDNATDANLIGRGPITEAAFTLGDGFENTGVICMHSVPYQRLVDADAIDYVKPSEGTLLIPFYLGKRLIVDDGMPVEAGGTSGFKYTSILYGVGAIGYGMGTPEVPVEVERQALQGKGAGQETLVTRKTWLIHPAGFKFESASVAAESASLAELALAVNWTRVFERKNVSIAFLVTNG